MSPSASAAPAAAPVVAFQANTGYLWTWTAAAGGRDTGLGMAQYTSPAVGMRSSSIPVIAFQANTGNLWLTDGSSASDTGLGMAPETDPAVAVRADDSFVVAFQDDRNDLWLYDSATGAARNLGFGLEPLSSPDVAVLADGSLQVAFQTNVNDIRVWNSVTGELNPGYGADFTSSPRITARGGDWAVAFIDDQTAGYVFAPASGTLALVPFTGGRDLIFSSADIAYDESAGRARVLFANLDNELEVADTSGAGAPVLVTAFPASTGLGAAYITSPAVTWRTGGQFTTAFQADTLNLWIVNSTASAANTGAVDTGLGMADFTSPAIG